MDEMEKELAEIEEEISEPDSIDKKVRLLRKDFDKYAYNMNCLLIIIIILMLIQIGFVIAIFFKLKLSF